jgi:hypothetical protein
MDDRVAQVVDEHLIGNIGEKVCPPLELSIPTLIVGNEKPFIVHDINDTFVSKFGFDRAVVCGRSIGFLQGPRTNSMLLAGAIEPRVKGSSNTLPASVVLYSKSGDEKAVTVCSTPMKSVDGMRKRLVSITDVESVSIATAKEGDSVAKVIIEASSPHAISFASPKFLEMYGLIENQVCRVQFGCFFPDLI